jgi:aminopeptidase N
MKNALLISLMLLPIILFSQDQGIEKSFRNKFTYNNSKKVSSFPITENQKNYDVKYYKLQLEIDTLYNTLTGSAEIILEVVKNPVSFIELDFVTNRPFDGKRLNSIESVWLNNEMASYQHHDSTLSITLTKECQPGEKIDIVVNYQNSADQYYMNFINVDGIKMILTLDEPFGARFWFPCKDYNEDKADSTDMIITVPENYVVASNGKLRDTRKEAGKATYYWHESFPIATYLMSISAYPYKTAKEYYKYSSSDSIEIYYYYLPKSEEIVKSSLSFIPGVLKVYSSLFGQYPFITEKYAEAEMSLAPGGMENQTCTSIQGWSKWVRAHELCHSWWGNMTTCKSFNHVWFQEGAATYFATLYFDLIGDKAEYKYWLNWARYTGPGIIYRYDLSDDFNVFNGNLVYQKASWVFHMLRFIGGDSLFFKAFRELYNDKRYKYNVIDTDELRQLFEQTYNMDLKWFFYQWIYEENCPNYILRWTKYDWGEKTNIKLNIIQDKENYIFKMPADITFKTTFGDTTFRIWDSLQTQRFTFTVNGKVDSMFFDKNDWILKMTRELVNIEYPKSAVEYSLSQNYPNPFNNSSKISFTLKEPGKTILSIYDILGRKVKDILNEELKAGKYECEINAGNLASGVYFYRLKSNSFNFARKFILLK